MSQERVAAIYTFGESDLKNMLRPIRRNVKKIHCR